MSKVETFSSKFEVEKYNGKENFSLCQKRVKTLLVQQSLHKTLQGKSVKHADFSDED